MEKIWAPWRINYIRARKTKGCFLCNSIKSRGKNYVVLKNKYTFAILNKYPYNNGHMLIAPIRHIKDISFLSNEEIIDFFETLKKAQKIINKILKPGGFNIGINTSEIAGAGVANHLHLHLVPRWKGDTNFMPVTSDAKIISQSLDELYKRLKNADPK